MPASLRRCSTSRSGSLLSLWKCQISGGLKACRLTVGIARLQVAQQFLVPFELQRRMMPPCIRIWSPPRAMVSSIFWYSSSRGRT